MYVARGVAGAWWNEANDINEYLIDTIAKGWSGGGEYIITRMRWIETPLLNGENKGFTNYYLYFSLYSRIVGEWNELATNLRNAS